MPGMLTDDRTMIYLVIYRKMKIELYETRSPTVGDYEGERLLYTIVHICSYMNLKTVRIALTCY